MILKPLDIKEVSNHMFQHVSTIAHTGAHICQFVCWQFLLEYRWLSMARTPISRSSRSLEVKLRSRFFSLYNKENLLLISQTLDLSKFSISRTKPWAPLHKFNCFSLSISPSPDCYFTLSNQACIKHTDWAYRYLDNGGHWGADMNVFNRCDTLTCV